MRAAGASVPLLFSAAGCSGGGVGVVGAVVGVSSTAANGGRSANSGGGSGDSTTGTERKTKHKLRAQIFFQTTIRDIRF